MTKAPLENRMDPRGDFHSDSSRAATLMGNRGILHNEARERVRAWVGKSWVACDMHFGGIDRRPLFKLGSYSELFFLDEATAYSAGHRPCGYCQRQRYQDFKSLWEARFSDGQAVHIKKIDTQLHLERVGPARSKLTYEAILDNLPDGTFVEIDGAPYLLQGDRLSRWSLEGYVGYGVREVGKRVEVLTPKSIVELFRRGLVPHVHDSASKPGISAQ